MDTKHNENSGLVLAPSLVKYAGNPLFGQDKPWEPRIDNGYPNVVYLPDNGDKTWQLWYDSFLSLQTSPWTEGTLYAQSADGIAWRKPDLGLVSFDGSSKNNIVFKNSGGVGVFRDIYTQNASERYKGFGVFPTIDGTAVSADGLHWEGFRSLKYQLNNRWDTHNNMFYDSGYPSTVDKYFGVTRGAEFPPRTVAVIKSEVNDFHSKYTNATVVLSGGDDNQTYAQITFTFYDIFLGLVMIFDSTSPQGRVYCELSWSPNMYDWHRVNKGQQVLLHSPNPFLKFVRAMNVRMFFESSFRYRRWSPSRTTATSASRPPIPWWSTAWCVCIILAATVRIRATETRRLRWRRCEWTALRGSAIKERATKARRRRLRWRCAESIYASRPMSMRAQRTAV